MEGNVDLGYDLQLDFDVTITLIITYDHRVVVEQDTYSFHLRDPDRPISWRYDRHDDHHGLGTEFHIHDRSDDNVRASGEVDLAMMDGTFGSCQRQANLFTIPAPKGG